MNNKNTQELKLYFEKYQSSIVIFPEGINNLYDLYKLNLVPNVVAEEIDKGLLSESIKTVKIINESLKAVNSNQVAKWVYFHYDLVYVLEKFNLIYFLEDETDYEDIYTTLIDSIQDIVDKVLPNNIKTRKDIETDYLLDEAPEDSIMLDFNGDLKINGLRMDQLLNIFVESNMNEELIKSRLLLINKVKEF
jgi:hypothetical protein